MEIRVHTKDKEYPILIERGILNLVKELLDDKQVYLVSEDGVPEVWRNILQDQFPKSRMMVFPQGEASKNLHTYQRILEDMLDHQVSRKDTLIALGGGVTGDMAGFCAATYMRGIRYINIPTTMLSMVDSSIGGKTAVDFGNVKNSVGAFWQPSMVFIDPDVLSTLSPRLLHEGMAEALKMGMTHDESLVEIFERDDYSEHIEEIIEKSLNIKKGVVERDERESGERKLLNFGHTYGHAFESYYNFKYLHGECVALGMMQMIQNPQIKERLKKILNRLELPVCCDANPEEIASIVMHDKKAEHGTVTIAQVDEVGKGHLETWNIQQIRKGLGL